MGVTVSDSELVRAECHRCDPGRPWRVACFVEDNNNGTAAWASTEDVTDLR
jgi:hypothetical protein